MEFHLLWCTKASELKTWAKYLNHFPVRLIHHFYNDLMGDDLDLICQKIALCISSESMFLETQSELQEHWKESHKPGIMVIENPSFAIAAFRFRFSHCLKIDQLERKLEPTLVESLAYYFHPNQKVSFLKNKLFISIDSKIFKIFNLNEIIMIKEANKTCEIVTIYKKTTISMPFNWLFIQYKKQKNLLFKITNEFAINLYYVNALEKVNKKNYCCKMNETEDILITKKQYKIMSTKLLNKQKV